MSAPSTRTDGNVKLTFSPDQEEDGYDWQDGKRKEIEKVSSQPLRWPTTSKERFDIFDAWHDVAMQLIQRARKSFRLIAVTKKVINWQSGTITGSNADLAARAGACSEKTISREVNDYAALGILSIEMGWRRSGTQVVRTRTIRPALPATIPADIHLPEVGFDLDNSGPDGWAIDLDNSGPGDLDNSGPITTDNHKRRV